MEHRVLAKPVAGGSMSQNSTLALDIAMYPYTNFCVANVCAQPAICKAGIANDAKVGVGV